MKPYKHIQEGEKVLKSLVNEAKKANNPLFKLQQLNKLIKMLNCFNDMLEEKYYTDFFDVLILSRLYSTLLINKPSDNINIKEFEIWINKDFRCGKDYITKNIVDFIKTHQLSNSIKQGYIQRDSDSDISKMIKKTLTEVKSNLISYKKWN